MKEQLLMILEKNARLSVEQLASLLNATPQQVAAEIEKLEKEGTILGYRSIIDWDKTDRDVCHARIEVQVTPEGGVGFEDIAARICQFEEVETVYLMSGIIDTREADVQAALAAAGFTVTDRFEEKGWVALAAKISE